MERSISWNPTGYATHLPSGDKPNPLYNAIGLWTLCTQLPASDGPLFVRIEKSKLNTKNETNRPSTSTRCVSLLYSTRSSAKKRHWLWPRIIKKRATVLLAMILLILFGLNQYLFVSKAALNNENETKKPLFTGRLVSFLVFNSITQVRKKVTRLSQKCTNWWAWNRSLCLLAQEPFGDNLVSHVKINLWLPTKPRGWYGSHGYFFAGTLRGINSFVIEKKRGDKFIRHYIKKNLYILIETSESGGNLSFKTNLRAWNGTLGLLPQKLQQATPENWDNLSFKTNRDAWNGALGMLSQKQHVTQKIKIIFCTKLIDGREIEPWVCFRKNYNMYNYKNPDFNGI